MQDFEVLARKAASQHGLLTRAQVKDAGLSRAQLDRLFDRRVLRAVSRKVLAIAGAPTSWEQSVMVGILTAGGLAVASHRSALRLWGLRDVDDQLELTIPSTRCLSVPGTTIHRSVDIQAEDRTVLDGVPVTAADRSLVDAGLIFPHREVRRLVARSLVLKIVTRDRLWTIRERVGRQGRNGVIALEQALETLCDESGADSDPELELRSLLRRSGLDEPVAQHRVALAGETYYLDLSYPSRRLALEYDGYDPHMTIDAFERDRRRQNALVLAGWTILRYTRTDLRDHPAHIVRQVRSALSLVL